MKVLRLAFFVFMCSSWLLRAETTYLFGWEAWEPYQYKDAKGELRGIEVDLVRELFKRMGEKLGYQEVPWKRFLVELEMGNVHIGSGASKTAEREAFAHFSDSYRLETMVLFVQTAQIDKYKLASIGDIRNYDFTLGVTRGFYYGDEYDKLIKEESFKKHLAETASDKANFEKLLAGRLDGTLSDPNVGKSLIKELKAQKAIAQHSLKAFSSDIFFILSKKSVPSLIVEKLNKALAAVKTDGTYQRIIDEYTK